MSFPLADLWFGSPPDDGEGWLWRVSPRSGEPESPALELIVQRLRAGDEAALREIWNQCYSRLTRIARRYMQSDDRAADVVQHVFIALWERRATVAPRGTIASHLTSAVRFRALHELRQIRLHEGAIVRAKGLMDDVPTVPNLGVADVEAAETRVAIQEALAALTPRVREIFVMHREGGLTAPEIAEVLGIRPQVVYNQLSKALKALAEGLSTLR